MPPAPRMLATRYRPATIVPGANCAWSSRLRSLVRASVPRRAVFSGSSVIERFREGGLAAEGGAECPDGEGHEGDGHDQRAGGGPAEPLGQGDEEEHIEGGPHG